MTVAALLREVAGRLTAGGIPSNEARGESRLIVGSVTGKDNTRLLLDAARDVPEEDAGRTLSLAARRVAREPLAYLLGTRGFYGLDFAVTPAVLIPRPETEFVVEDALSAVRGRPAPRVVDVGTGSGIIAITLAVHAPGATLFATDISPDALAVAQRNAEAHGVAGRVSFSEGDLLAPVLDRVPFDVIASNPPYIAPAEVETLEPEVRDWEPRIALGTHPDALHFYRRLSVEAPPLLAAGGSLIVEVGQGQADDVSALFSAGGLKDVRATPDYAGIARVVSGVKR